MLLVKHQLGRPKNTHKLALTLATLAKNKNSEQGISLLECLMAIVVIAVVITSFTPPIILAVATRVQNRRAEQAVQLAQGEIDKVRRTVEQGNYADTDLPPIGASNVRLQPAPSSSRELQIQRQPSPERFPSSASESARIDLNGDGSTDFYVQTYRSPGIPENGKTVAFCLGVRVYSASAIRENFGQLESPPQHLASLQLTNAMGAQKRRPLALIYTSVVNSDTSNSLVNLTNFLGAPCQ